MININLNKTYTDIQLNNYVYAKNQKADKEWSDEYWDINYSIPVQRDKSSNDYPVYETLLLLRWPNQLLMTFIKVSDNEYKCIIIDE